MLVLSLVPRKGLGSRRASSASRCGMTVIWSSPPITARTARIRGSAKAALISAARASGVAPTARVVGYSTGIRPVTSVSRRIACSCTAGKAPAAANDGERTAICSPGRALTGRARSCAMSVIGRPFSRSRRGDHLTHHAVVLALGSLVVEAGLFEHAAGGAVEEGGRDLLSRRVLRVGLHDTAPGNGDQVQGAVERGGGHPSAAAIAVHEKTGDAVVRRRDEAGFVLLPVIDAGEFRRRSELAPAHRDVTIENQGCVRPSLPDQELLIGPPGLDIDAL